MTGSNMLATLAISAALAGCASDAAVVAARSDGVVCRKEAPTGSNMPVTRCTTSVQREEDRDAAERFKRSIPPTPSSSTAGSPGSR